MTDRVFKAADLWRIYCNNLTEVEQASFRRDFIGGDGDCLDGGNPCGEVERDVKDARKGVSGYKESISRFEVVTDELVEGIATAADGIVDFLGSIVDDIAAYNAEQREETIARWDERYKERYPDPIERAEVVAETMQTIDIAISSVGGGFVKSGKVATNLIKDKRLWDLKGKVAKKSKIELDKAAEIAIAAIDLAVTVADVISKDC
ncbi:hypothetical protein SNEBB_007426 [Seison nebaliae]|nr:hypothetical protein SNEBB_007426 [Seison nebaliae]